MGIGFLLQSNNQAPAYLYNRYFDFYAQADKRLKSLKEADFNQYKLALVNQLRQRPQTLDEEAGRFTNDFDRGNFEFNTREKLIKQIDVLNRENIVTFYRQAVIKPQGMALLSQVLGGHAKGHYAAPKVGRPMQMPPRCSKLCLLRLRRNDSSPNVRCSGVAAYWGASY